MRHHNKNRTMGRNRAQRAALLRSLAISLIENERIQTTEARAKELRPYIERLVTYGKRGTIAARRNAATKLGEPRIKTIRKLFDQIAEAHKDRNGGYTRIIKIGEQTPGKREAIIEFVK